MNATAALRYEQIIPSDGTLTAAVSFANDACGKVREIYIIRNPDRLAPPGPLEIR